MAEIKYIVRRKFKYGNTWLFPGNEFIPSGGKFDEGILKSNLVAQNLDEFNPGRMAFKRGKLQRQGKQKVTPITEDVIPLDQLRDVTVLPVEEVKAKPKTAHKAKAGGE